MDYQTLKVGFQETVCRIQIDRPDDNNTINGQMISEFRQVLEKCRKDINIIVLEGLPDVFCFGADLKDIVKDIDLLQGTGHDPKLMYEIWQELAAGPFISIAHVRGRTNAGGVGFAAACDIILADNNATFSLSELLFGIYPACVLPFLIRKIGFQKAHYMTLMTRPIPVEKAHSWGLVDEYDEQSESLLHKHLVRLKPLSKAGISRYKNYANGMYRMLEEVKENAVSANKDVFSDPVNMEGIRRFVETGRFPWEKN